MRDAVKDKTVVTYKLPHNFGYPGLIEIPFPNALIIHCIRNARDTCLSNYFQLFTTTMTCSLSLKDIGWHYQLYKKMMAHWDETLSLGVMEVNYQDLVV